MKTVNIRRHLNHGIYSLLNRFSIVAFGFLNVLVIVRMISKEIIGVWVLYTTVTAIIEMVRAGFIRNPLIVTLINHPEPDEKKEVIGTSFVLHSMLAVVISLMLAGLSGTIETFWHADGLSTLFFIYAFQNLALIAFFHAEYMQTALLKFDAVFYSNLIRQGVPSLYILVSFVFGLPISLYSIALAQIAGVVAGSIAGFLQLGRDSIPGLKVKWSRMHELFNFGKFTLGTNISSTVLRSTDSWMLGRLVSPAAVAIYSPALKLANIFEVPTLAISNFIFPKIATRMKQDGAAGVKDLYLKSVSLILALTIPLTAPLYFFPDFFVGHIFGPAYLEASPILKVTVLYSLIVPFNRQYGTTMDALNKPRLNFYLLLMATILNAVLNYFMLQWFGIIGCAYATLASFVILFLVNQVIMYRLFQVNTFLVLPYIVQWYSRGFNILKSQLEKRLLVLIKKT
jgi:lipopolysaccharide exporter